MVTVAPQIKGTDFAGSFANAFTDSFSQRQKMKAELEQIREKAALKRSNAEALFSQIRGMSEPRSNGLLEGADPQGQQMQSLTGEGGSPARKEAGLDDFDAALLSNLYGEKEIGDLYKMRYQEGSKLREKERASKEELKGIVGTLERLDQTVGDVSLPGWNPLNAMAAVPGTEAYQKRQEFDSEGFLAADKVFTKFNKGTITKEKLKIIQEQLAPNSRYSEKTNRGRIKALRTVLGLPENASEAKIESAIKKVKKETEGEGSGKERPPLSSFMR